MFVVAVVHAAGDKMNPDQRLQPGDMFTYPVCLPLWNVIARGRGPHRVVERAPAESLCLVIAVAADGEHLVLSSTMRFGWCSIASGAPEIVMPEFVVAYPFSAPGLLTVDDD